MKATCYDVLGVPQCAGAAEIRSAYRKLAARFHPDRNAATQEKFLAINQAYVILSDPEKRRDYDRTLPGEYRKKPTLGDQIEAALRSGIRRPPPTRSSRNTPKAKARTRPPQKSVPYDHFSEWTRAKLRKEFGTDVGRSFWELRTMFASKFVRTWIEPYDFLIRPEILADMGSEFHDEEILRTFFMDPRGSGKPRIWGKHRAIVAATLGVGRVKVYVRVS